MKKLFTLALAALMACGAAQAQKAFRQVGVSLEAGTTGVGANLSLPVVSNHLILTVGYNFPSFGLNRSLELNSGSISQQMQQAIGKIDEYNQFVNADEQRAQLLGLTPISTTGLQQSINSLNADIEAKLNFGNFKALVEYYPTLKSAFHITVGVYYGNGEWMNINATADASVWSTYKDVVQAHDQLEKIFEEKNLSAEGLTTLPSVREAAKISINGQSFRVDPETGKLDAILSVKKVKPYLGIGFGSSVPTKKRMGFQMELGAYYQGKPELVSDQEVFYDSKAYSNETIDNLVDLICKLQWYPQLTFRWTGRIF